jgi:hypothetical protein
MSSSEEVSIEDWQEAFSLKVKTKSFEQFSLFLIDIKTTNSNFSLQVNETGEKLTNLVQKNLLYNILFKDHKSIDFWTQYLEYVSSIFSEKKLQLQRLYFKANEILDCQKEDIKYLTLQLKIISFKQ